jgi:hypothetical protein
LMTMVCSLIHCCHASFKIFENGVEMPIRKRQYASDSSLEEFAGIARKFVTAI